MMKTIFGFEEISAFQKYMKVFFLFNSEHATSVPWSQLWLAESEYFNSTIRWNSITVWCNYNRGSLMDYFIALLRRFSWKSCIWLPNWQIWPKNSIDFPYNTWCYQLVVGFIRTRCVLPVRVKISQWICWRQRFCYRSFLLIRNCNWSVSVNLTMFNPDCC